MRQPPRKPAVVRSRCPSGPRRSVGCVGAVAFAACVSAVAASPAVASEASLRVASGPVPPALPPEPEPAPPSGPAPPVLPPEPEPAAPVPAAPSDAAAEAPPSEPSSLEGGSSVPSGSPAATGGTPPASVPGTESPPPPAPATIDPIDLPDPPRDPGPGDRAFARGTVLLITGGMLGGTLVLARDVVFAAMLADLARARTDPVGSDAATGAGYLAALGTIIAAPTQLIGTIPIAMVASGARQRGRWAGWYASDLHPPNAALRRRARVGSVLVGVGSAVLVGQLVTMVGMAVRGNTYGAAFPLVEVGLSLTATGLIVPGLAIGPFARGVLEGRRARGAAGLVVAPARFVRGAGVTVGGRF